MNFIKELPDMAVEITTNIGCPLQCKQYCPQDITIKNYGNRPRMMLFETFKQLLITVPKEAVVAFAGYSEPFNNPDCFKMIKYAYNKGHRIVIFSTLYGLREQDVEELIKIPFEKFTLHLPDGLHMKEPTTLGYRNNLLKVFTIPNLEVMFMNNRFETNGREDNVRGNFRKTIAYGKCDKFTMPCPEIMPNGDVYLCCQDFGLHHYLGNLLVDEYAFLVNKFLSNEGKYSECTHCSYNIEYYRYMLRSGYNAVLQIYHKIRRVPDKKPTIILDERKVTSLLTGNQYILAK